MTAELDTDSWIDHGRHHQVAIRLLNLMEQDIQNIARMELRPSGTRDRTAIATRVSELCKALTRAPGTQPLPAVVESSPELQEQAEEVQKRFAELLHEAFSAGGFIAFDFTADFGTPASGEYQRCWGTDPADPIAFVVVPAYVVEGQHFSHQIVFTEPAD